MELTLWWVEERSWINKDVWQPAYGPYVDHDKAGAKARKIDAAGDWYHREPTTRVRGITITGEEVW